MIAGEKNAKLWLFQVFALTAGLYGCQVWATTSLTYDSSSKITPTRVMLNQWHGQIVWFPLGFMMWATVLRLFGCLASLVNPLVSNSLFSQTCLITISQCIAWAVASFSCRDGGDVEHNFMGRGLGRPKPPTSSYIQLQSATNQIVPPRGIYSDVTLPWYGDGWKPWK